MFRAMICRLTLTQAFCYFELVDQGYILVAIVTPRKEALPYNLVPLSQLIHLHANLISNLLQTFGDSLPSIKRSLYGVTGIPLISCFQKYGGHYVKAAFL